MGMLQMAQQINNYIITQPSCYSNDITNKVNSKNDAQNTKTLSEQKAEIIDELIKITQTTKQVSLQIESEDHKTNVEAMTKCIVNNFETLCTHQFCVSRWFKNHIPGSMQIAIVDLLKFEKGGARPTESECAEKLLNIYNRCILMNQNKFKYIEGLCEFIKSSNKSSNASQNNNKEEYTGHFNDAYRQHNNETGVTTTNYTQYRRLKIDKPKQENISSIDNYNNYIQTINQLSENNNYALNENNHNNSNDSQIKNDSEILVNKKNISNTIICKQREIAINKLKNWLSYAKAIFENILDIPTIKHNNICPHPPEKTPKIVFGDNDGSIARMCLGFISTGFMRLEDDDLKKLAYLLKQEAAVKTPKDCKNFQSDPLLSKLVFEIVENATFHKIDTIIIQLGDIMFDRLTNNQAAMMKLIEKSSKAAGLKIENGNVVEGKLIFITGNHEEFLNFDWMTINDISKEPHDNEDSLREKLEKNNLQFGHYACNRMKNKKKYNEFLNTYFVNSYAEEEYNRIYVHNGLKRLNNNTYKTGLGGRNGATISGENAVKLSKKINKLQMIAGHDFRPYNNENTKDQREDTRTLQIVSGHAGFYDDEATYNNTEIRLNSRGGDRYFYPAGLKIC